MNPSDNETWLIEIGDEVIVKKADQGEEALSAIERLIYCVWVADYSMRNAGDLLTAEDLYAPYREEGERRAEKMRLAKTRASFGLSSTKLEDSYFDAFEEICSELQSCLAR